MGEVLVRFTGIILGIGDGQAADKAQGNP